jgi:flagellar motor switch protein FliM
MTDEPDDQTPAMPSADAPAGGLLEDQPSPAAESESGAVDPWASGRPRTTEQLAQDAADEAEATNAAALVADTEFAHVIEREEPDPRDIELKQDNIEVADLESDPHAIEHEQSDPRAIERDASGAGVAEVAELESDPHAIEHEQSDPRAIEGDASGAEAKALATLGTPRRVRPVDFRRPTKFTRDQMRRLESAHDGFCRGASTRLTAELRTGVEIEVTTSDQLSYAAVMNELPEDAIVTILDVDPIDTQVALIFELPLAVNLIDRLLGAIIARKTMPTGLTDLEAVVLQRVIRSIVEPLSATWHDLAGVRFSIAVAASTPANAQFAAPSEPCLLLRGEAHIDGTSSPIVFCLPHVSVEPLMERLEKAHVRNRAVDERATEMLRQAVSGVDVELRAEVGAVEMEMSEVLALRPGDVLALRASAADGVSILAGDVRSYMAAPGRNNAARAVQITGPYREANQ